MNEFETLHQEFSSNAVHSNQSDVHENLINTLERYQLHPFNKKPADHTCTAFEQALQFIQQKNVPLILDSGCGTGHSSIHLAQQYPHHQIIALDKSGYRLAKLESEFSNYENLLVLQADQFDFWFLAEQHKIFFEKHFILYPNPWPKKSHLKKRFYAHPHFRSACAISHSMTVRSNWLIFLKEFEQAIHFYLDISPNIHQINPERLWTLFERKFYKSGQLLYQADF